MSPSSDVIVSHLFIKILTTPNLWCLGWWDVTFRHWSVWVFYVYTMDFTLPSPCLVNVSMNGMLMFSPSSLVNVMLPVGSTVFICCCNSSSLPVRTRQMTSSTHRFQFLGLQSSGAVAMMFCYNFFMYKSTTTGGTGLPIATPIFCW